jgi:hypothetical protein
MVVNLATQCGCQFTITGGTETTGGHTNSGTRNHINGYKVDIAANDMNDLPVADYVIHNMRRLADRTGDPQFVDGKGNTFVLENYSNPNPNTVWHWDVTWMGR